MYDELFAAFAGGAVGCGEGCVLDPVPAWEGNASERFFTVVQWQKPDDTTRFNLVVVNLAPHRAQCRVRLTARGLENGLWRLEDRLGTEHWERDGSEMGRDGLFLDLGPTSAQLFWCSR
jgi:hypothetical protein